MFEYDADIAVLHGALISHLDKAKFLFKQETGDEYFKDDVFTHLEKENCAEIASSVTKACLELSSEFQYCHKYNDQCARRMHSLIFYTVAKLNKEEDCQSYFESVSDVLPKISWCFYFELVKAFHWTKYCSECVVSLPLDDAKGIIHLIIKHFNKKRTDSDYTLLCCYIEIIFELCHEYINHSSYQAKENEISTYETRKNTSADLSDTEIFNSLIKDITLCIQSTWTTISSEENKENVIKVSLASLLLLCKHVRDEKYSQLFQSDNEENCTNFSKMSLDKSFNTSNILQLLHCTVELVNGMCDIINSTVGRELISDCARSLKNVEISSLESYFEWDNISFGSLLFHVYQYLKDILATPFPELSEDIQILYLSLNELSNYLRSIFCFNLSPFWLTGVCDFLTSTTNVSLYECHDLLDDIWLKRHLITEDIVLEYFERNIKFLSNSASLPALLEVVMNNAVSQQERATKIILDAFEKSTVQKQWKILETFLNSYGPVDALKCPNFDNDLTQFLNQIVHKVKHGSKVQSQILKLCLQSSQDVITFILLQAIKNNGDIIALSQILRIIPFICSYSKSGSCSLLVKCLHDVIRKEQLSKQQMQNTISFIQILLQEETKECKTILLPENILLWCVLPYLKTSDALLDFTIEVLQVIVENMIHWTEKINMLALIYSLFKFLEYYAIQRNGEKRQIIIMVLKSLINHLVLNNNFEEDKNVQWVLIHLKPMNSLWYAFFDSKLHKKEIDIKNLENTPIKHLLSGGSFDLNVNTVITLLKRKTQEVPSSFQYTFLVVVLSEVLLYTTFDEWKFIYSVITSYLCDSDIQMYPVILNSLSDELPENCIHVMKGIHIFIDVIVLISVEHFPNIPWHYILSCFNKLLKEMINISEKYSIVIMYLFCEICRLATSLGTDFVSEITAPLFDLVSIFRKSHLEDKGLERCMLKAVNTIPICDTVTNLRKHFKQL